MSELLDNPVYHALCSGDADLGSGKDGVYWFDEAVSPFVGFSSDDRAGFEKLHTHLPPGRRVLYATRQRISTPEGWTLAVEVEGLQFVYPERADGILSGPGADVEPRPLTIAQVPEMIALARLTRPGPFDTRTIEFGHYHGIFENGRLAAMTGQRLHPDGYAEISAVCTHPDFLGKGYASLLLRHQLRLILEQGKIPFLHVRADNARAVGVYERLGFERNGPMNFYFMKRA